MSYLTSAYSGIDAERAFSKISLLSLALPGLVKQALFSGHTFGEKIELAFWRINEELFHELFYGGYWHKATAGF